MPHSRWLLVALVTGSSVVAAACGSSGYQYVENEDLGVYAKVPDDWAMYDEQQLFQVLAALRGGGVSLDRDLARTWYRGFDSSDEPTVLGTQRFGSPTPRGFVQIQALLPEQSETVSTSLLRGMLTGTDPLAAMEQDPAGGVEVLSDEPVEFDGGYHGVHTVYAMTLPDTSTAVIDQTVVLDASNSVLYMFVVGCDPGCYSETHADVIDTIVESWTIQEEGS